LSNRTSNYGKIELILVENSRILTAELGHSTRATCGASRQEGRWPLRTGSSTKSAPILRSILVFLGCFFAVDRSFIDVAWAEPALIQTDLFTQWTDGYAGYRVPAMVVTNSGALLAFADGKKTYVSDLSPTDVVLKRSFDNGKTWDALQVVADGGNQYFGSATPVVDRQTGDIIVPFLVDNWSVYVTRSSDNGSTWSTPVDITTSVKDPNWQYYATGPGHAIQLDSGRLLIPSVHRFEYNTFDPSYSGVFYSDDHGATWQAGGTVNTPGTNEAQIAQLSNGSLYMNMRTKSQDPYRWSSSSTDGGLTWTPAQQNTQLLDPSVHGSLEWLNRPSAGEPGRLLFANPTDPVYRQEMSVHMSYDEGANWSKAKTVYFGPSAYSDMAVTSDQTVNLLYERARTNTPGSKNLYQTITLAQFDKNFLEGNVPYNLRWDFNEQASGEAPADDAYIRDKGGWDLHAQAIDSPTYIAGDPRNGAGSALRFTSGPDHLLLARTDSTSFFRQTADSSFTLETDFRTTDHGSGGQDGAGFIASWGRNGLSNWWLAVQDGKLRFFAADDNYTTGELFSTVTVNDGNWHRAAVIRDANEHVFKLFVDNALVGMVPDFTGAYSSDGGLMVGQFGNGAYQFSGDVDYLQFIDSILSQVLLGDMNGDGTVNNFDALAFEMAAANPSEYLAQFPGLTDYEQRGDFNRDGLFNNFDVSDFELNAVVNFSSPVPEPGAFVLMAVGTVIVVGIAARRKSTSSRVRD